MSNQTRTATYCSTNQTYKGWSVNITVDGCVSEGEYITPQGYNSMIEALKIQHDFGEADSVSRQPNLSHVATAVADDTYVLNKKNQLEIINLDFYNNIANALGQKRKEQQYNIIYGTYFDDLVTTILDYKIPSTRYYSYTVQCCDCHGNCCDSDCDCGNCGQGCYCHGDCYSNDSCAGMFYAGG